MPEPTSIHRAKEIVHAAGSVAVLTGAGVSAESGVATFRGEDGLWRDRRVEEFATPEGFAADPCAVWQWYSERRQEALAAQPNAAHQALAALQQQTTHAGGRFTLITQNVDCLHQHAGSTDVLELHGSIRDMRCCRCAYRRPIGDDPVTGAPRCPACDQLLRPDVVWFGEMLPQDILAAAIEAATTCDLFMTIGTSAIVYPAAGLIRQAIQAGAKTIEINLDPTPASSLVDIALHGPAGEILPALIGQRP
ncbi:MAG TPA: NAD-dependent deacylase [Phycisphaerae bacterium]|nr:NAD-dependent deacylase [Phycisphaerae bacterium]HDZ44465.1 NAD-dependent deacylase [Phycisphaerae bacterium]